MGWYIDGSSKLPTCNPRISGSRSNLAVTWLPHVGQKTAFDRFAGTSNDLVVTRLAAHLDRNFRYHHDRRVGGAARSSAVPTVTVQHQDWISVALVMDRAAGAPTGQFLCQKPQS
jgi:hypothetical protein